MVLVMLNLTKHKQKKCIWSFSLLFSTISFLAQLPVIQIVAMNKSLLHFIFAGKCSCVGESLACMELFLFIVSLLQKFSFSSPKGPDGVDTSPELSSFANMPRLYQLIASPRWIFFF